MIQKLKNFIEKETVMVIAFLLALVSCFFMTPSLTQLAGFVDFRVLGILLSLMVVVAGLQRVGAFDWIGVKLLVHVSDTRSLVLVLVMLCFFLSMAVTNDVALLTFVPFAIFVLEKSGHPELLVSTVVLQTVAANLGSMLTPVGNPQNLYIYQHYRFTAASFIETVLPYAAAAFLMLLILIFLGKKESIRLAQTDFAAVHTDWKRAGAYVLLFCVAIAAVTGLFYWFPAMLLILLAAFLSDREILRTVDYCLLLTFVFFFVFIGNMGSIPLVRDLLGSLLTGNEAVVSILASQVISNVPATLLLSEFTENSRDLLIGVNLGGLGTLIASMASLISYKLYAHRYNETKGRYLLWFTVVNLVFLTVLYGLYLALGRVC
ncbi:MAG: SLC13 family permease [Firmicutes bacterium]|nr:SLC13 family permease [Bacillota bacterium]